jgi:hypothetical protein
MLGCRQSQQYVWLFLFSYFLFCIIPTICFGPYGPSSGGIYSSQYFEAIMPTTDLLFSSVLDLNVEFSASVVKHFRITGFILHSSFLNCGSIVVKALFYKPEGHGFEAQWGECIFSIYLILPAALGCVVCSASNRNEYQKQKNNVSGV